MRSPEDDAHHPLVPHHPAASRRKGTATRPWLVVSATGTTHLEEMSKHSIMRRTGLPARDLRVLDPILSYPSTIFGRDRAIIINLDHIKAIITATEVFVANSKDPCVASFVHELQSHAAALPLPAMGPSDGEREAVAKATLNGTGGHEIESSLNGEMPQVSPRTTHAAKVLPFEFRVLEVCLESACRCLESETLTLEQEAYPALDELTSKVSTLNLERVRQIKSRLVAISGCMQKVRDELEHLLDDDTDMAEMYLSEKLVHQPAGETPSRVDIDTDAPELDENGDEDLETEIESNHGKNFDGFKPNIQEFEMLLEAYFVQIDGTLNKLSTLREYVDDTEDYINIMLDDKQNQLLQVGVMLSTATLVLTAGVSVTGLFGMNIHISITEDDAPTTIFWPTTFGTVGGCILLYILAIGWGKKRGLLQ